MIHIIGFIVLAGGIGHVITGLIIYRPQLTAIANDGFINAVLPHFDRRAALWFILFGVLAAMTGHLLIHAAQVGDLTKFMIDFILTVFSYRFMQFALFACLLASIGCGVIGPFVVVKRVGFLAGGIAHTALAGMGIAYFLGASPLLGATAAALLSAVLIGWIKLRWKQDEDILIAAFWSVGMAIGILFISQTPGYNVDLMSYLFGNILLVGL